MVGRRSSCDCSELMTRSAKLPFCRTSPPLCLFVLGKKQLRTFSLALFDFTPSSTSNISPFLFCFDLIGLIVQHGYSKAKVS